jgi:exosome complex component RRP4
MSEVLFENRKVVVPGEVIAKGMDFLPGKGTFREGEDVIASRLGMVNVKGSIIGIIPLTGVYLPRKDQTVIGYVRDMSYSSWFINVGTPYDGSLSLKDATEDFIERGTSLSNFFAVGDIILTRITNVTNEGNIDLTMKRPGLRKLKGGKVIEVSAVKIPRIVGKQGSMISLIKEHTGCSIFAGQNGRVWIKGPNPQAELVATKTVRLIESLAHTQGLTDRVKAFLEKETKETTK